MLASRRVVWGAILLLLSFGVLLARLWPFNMDAGWLLHAAGAMLDGSILYRDLIEVNPPLVIWLTSGPVLAARLAGIPEMAAFHFALGALALASVMLLRVALAPLREEVGAGPIHLVLIGAAFIVAVWPRYMFGEREHLAVIFILPYLGVLAGRLSGRPCGTGLAVAAGIAAAIGVALKPYFLVVPLATEVVRLARPSGRPAQPGLLRPELVAGAAVLATYAVLVLVAVPHYFELLYLRPVYALFDRGWEALLVRPESLLVGLLLASRWLVRPRGPLGDLRDILDAAAVAFFVVALVQQKGWAYHYLPATSLALLGLITLAAQKAAGRKRGRLARTYVAVILGVVVGMSALQAVLVSLREEALSDFRKDVEFVGRHAGEGPVLILTAEIAVGFPLVNHADVVWGAPFPSAWPFLRPAAGAAPDIPAELRHRAEELFLDALESETGRRPPTLVGIDVVSRRQDLEHPDFRAILSRRQRLHWLLDGDSIGTRNGVVYLKPGRNEPPPDLSP